MHPLNDILMYFLRGITPSAFQAVSEFEGFLYWVKWISLFLSLFFIWATAHVRSLSKQPEFISDEWHLRFGGQDLGRRKFIRLWKNTVKQMQNGSDRAAWTDSLKAGEGVMQEALRVKGYIAPTDRERTMLALEDSAFGPKDALHSAQAAYKKAKSGEPITHQEAIDGLKAYKAVVNDLGILDTPF